LVIARSFQEEASDIRVRDVIGVDVGLATAIHDYPDRGFGAMASAAVRQVTLVILAAATAHVMSVVDLRVR
jgi:hypothetical protein